MNHSWPRSTDAERCLNTNMKLYRLVWYSISPSMVWYVHGHHGLCRWRIQWRVPCSMMYHVHPSFDGQLWVSKFPSKNRWWWHCQSSSIIPELILSKKWGLTSSWSVSRPPGAPTAIKFGTWAPGPRMNQLWLCRPAEDLGVFEGDFGTVELQTVHDRFRFFLWILMDSYGDTDALG